MKNLVSLCAVFAVAFTVSSQVEIDKPISLTGPDGSRSIINLEAPVAGTDAVNKDYVDSAVSAGGGGSPTMISAESATAMNYGAALRYCNALSEGGHSDWYLPNEKELFYVVSKGGVSVSTNTSANAIWFAGDWVSFGGSAWDSRCSFRLSDGSYATVNPLSTSNYYVRCVR